MEVMSALLGVIERETELVRAGKVREAMALGAAEVGLVAPLRQRGRASQSQRRNICAQAAPELLTTLHRHHDTFRAMLQINLTVLATAHAVSEGIVRGVNAEIQRRNIPNTYTSAGQRAGAGTAQHHAARRSAARSERLCAGFAIPTILTKFARQYRHKIHRVL